MAEEEPQLNWKRQYEYVCIDCGKKRFTVHKWRALVQLCTLCAKAKVEVNENQKTIFD